MDNLAREIDFTYHGALELSNAEYHAAPGISSSKLKLLDESCVHLDHAALFTRQAKNLDFGSLVHKQILEPDYLEHEFAISPVFNLRTIQGKADKEKFYEDNAGKTILDREDYETAQVMARNVRAIAGNLLANGVAEQSYFVEDNGLLLKCRPDFFIPALAIVSDVKTIADISEYGIKKAISTYRYAWSAVFYIKVLRLLGYEAERFMFIFVESVAPYMVKIREIHPSILQNAEVEVQAMLDKYLHYKLTGKTELYKQVIPFEVR